MADEKQNEKPVVTYTACDYSEKYSNNTSAEGRLLDFRLRFGLSVHPEPGSEDPFMVEYFQAILLSPQEAKLLAIWLWQEIRRYEELFGPIPIAKSPVPTPATEPDAAAVAAAAQRPN